MLLKPNWKMPAPVLHSSSGYYNLKKPICSPEIALAEYQKSVLYTMATKFARVPSCPYSAPSSTSSFGKEKWRNRWVHSLKHTHRFKHFPWPEWEVKTVLKNLYYVGMELNLPWVLLHLCETDLCNHLPLNQNTTQQSCDYTISDDK